MRGSLDDAERAWVKEQWIAGRSAGEIVRDLGAGVTRNMVIGIICRAGLQRGPGASVIRQRKPSAITLPRPARKAPVPVVAFDLTTDPALVVDMIGAGKHHCRFPVELPGDSRFLYCGRDKDPGSTFCAGHRARATQPQLPKKDRRK